MPEPRDMVPLYVARVADLRRGRVVALTCRSCGHVAELPVDELRRHLEPSDLVKHLGPQFRCRRCGHKGAVIDARQALGHYG
jgi:transcription elongation factor Elf1